SPGASRHPLPQAGEGTPHPRLLRAFACTQDEIDLVLRPMFERAAEPIGSMGDDTPLAALSPRPRLLFSFFKQRFAQVTNPPIDPLRESLVMDLGEPLVEAPHGHVIPMLFETNLERALVALTEASVRTGAQTLVLSDRGIDGKQAAIPSLLAVSAVHHRLVEEGLRRGTTLLVDSGEARDDHSIAALLAFGADAVCPWLALRLAGEGRANYLAAIRKGLLKILSKMGVSTMRSYRGAQLFEAVGIADEVIDRWFPGVQSSISGLALDAIERSALARHRAAFSAASAQLEDAGLFRFRRNGEPHAYNPGVVKALHTAIRSGRPLDYRSYARLVHEREPLTLRDLLEFREGTPVPIDEVEPAPAIIRRFMTAAMSLGALSPEAQSVLAEAMNRLGARSNSGEGGEPPEWYGTARGNRIKQIASGRFGVTAEYVVSASELQIKIAQGSKPGEGGQLPGPKVTPFIARIRHAAPGTTLISPPPHHDIYSIEDLAQLVYDLKRVNPAATVSVKLVSSAGIGTIAVGVAKAHADAIEISGHDGGTGASPLGSIKNAGTPWEIGLSEVQQSLMRAGLRDRVRLQVDGGIKTGRDVVMAALLGAEEFGFGTAALVAAGCVMARQCHLNTCPVGIATQREELRAKFNATADDVVRFFTAVAEEVREIVALLGFRTFDEIVGRSELLAVHESSPLSFARILAPLPEGPRRRMRDRNDPPLTGSRLDEAVLQRPRLRERSFGITTADRSAGARIAGERARRGSSGTLRLAFRGTAGQSFGAFCGEGMHLVLDGDANDYAGKSMSGGQIVVRGDAGNTLLYGATGGRAFIAGRAGERFAVRNSGAFAVVEGTGDHACEYMTGGAVVILGPTGRNVGAGMSGGTLFVLDLDERLVNSEYAALAEEIDEGWLYEAVALHVEESGSRRAAALLSNWNQTRSRFARLAPLGAPAIQSLPEIEPVRKLKRRSG
ncbi:MAG TPA: glutamate synthase-related protein, partial [Thermoanaerobaculia bacterium]|nr:glutamate synthase-related protein [Thermoanaerobaculia bacterium]